MSNSFNEQAQAQGEKSSKPNQGVWTKEKVKKVPLKLSAVHQVDAELANDSSGLGEPIVILISCGEHSQQLTIHRPVGQHGLKEDDWVLTPTSEVGALLASAEDPSKAKKEAALAKCKLDYLVEIGKYLKIGEELHYPPAVAGGASLKSVNGRAKEAWSDAKRAAHEEYLRECEHENRKPKKDWKFGLLPGYFQEAEVKTYEEDLKQKLKTDPVFEARVKKLAIAPYVTKAGPYGDRPQTAMTLAEPATRRQMVDVCKKHIVNTMSSGYKLPTPMPKALVSAWKVDQSAEEKLKDFVSSLFPAPDPGAQAPASAAAPSVPNKPGSGAATTSSPVGKDKGKA